MRRQDFGPYWTFWKYIWRIFVAYGDVVTDLSCTTDFQREMVCSLFLWEYKAETLVTMLSWQDFCCVDRRSIYVHICILSKLYPGVSKKEKLYPDLPAVAVYRPLKSISGQRTHQGQSIYVIVHVLVSLHVCLCRNICLRIHLKCCTARWTVKVFQHVRDRRHT